MPISTLPRPDRPAISLTSIMIFAVLVVMLTVIAAAPPYVSGQVFLTRTGEAESIDGMTQTAVIDSVARALRDVYVFPDIALKMEEKIRRNLKNGLYNRLDTYDAFTVRLTEDLREVSHDKHLNVLYSPHDPRREEGGDADPEEQERRTIERMAYNNYQFFKLERLPGNVGYVDLRAFIDAKYSAETAIAAMNFLANCDAVIFDLRKNGGGYPSLIQLISSYFFEEPVHLNSFYIRDEDRTEQFWTSAHVEGPKMTDVDLYILTSSYTFSGAEEFAYDMKHLERATLVGETTGGGAHPVRFVGFPDLKISMSLPFGRAINPITGTNWEGKGVEPHIHVSQEKALETAHLAALEKLEENAENEERRGALQWEIAGVKADSHPVSLDIDTMKRYCGLYSPRSITLEAGDLYYRREGNSPMKMIPMAGDLFMFEELDFFRLRVITDEDGNGVALEGLYADGHTDRSERTE